MILLLRIVAAIALMSGLSACDCAWSNLPRQSIASVELRNTKGAVIPLDPVDLAQLISALNGAKCHERGKYKYKLNDYLHIRYSDGKVMDIPMWDDGEQILYHRDDAFFVAPAADALIRKYQRQLP